MSASQPEGSPPELPFKRARPSIFQRAPVTVGLMAFTGLVFVAQSISLAMTGQDWLLAYGVKARAPILNGQWWRLITPIFLHLSLSHIFVNMFSLYALAPQIERFFGSWRMLTFYLISGVGGVGFSLALSDNPSAGASGAIFGVVGALGTFIYLHQKFLGRMGRQQLGRIAMITLLNLALGLSPGIDNWAHIGGLVTGIGLTFWFGPRLEPVPVSEGQLSLVDRRPWAGVQGGVAIAAVAVISLAVAAAYAFS